MACEKCWNDAFRRAMTDGRSQADHYLELLAERKDTPCGPQYDSEEYFKLGGLGNPIEIDEEIGERNEETSLRAHHDALPKPSGSGRDS